VKEFSFSEIYIGLEQSFEAELTQQNIDQFLAITGDNNPLHVDQEYARAKGFQDRVVYGMLSSSFYSTLVGVYLPGKYALLQGIDIQFVKPVFCGDSLKVYGKVTYINEAYRQIEVKAQITNQHSVKISKATIKIGLINE
jgi:3-hydroxybutyryl-CoA dehydratase